jgi:GT2 family glycosyltransferase
MSSLSKKSLPPTSLIICSRNRPQLLLETVESILHGDQIPTELIVIDQSKVLHPTLSALETGGECEIRYLWTHNTTGLSRARNAGIAAARHDILAFTDDDVLVTPTWFGSLIQALVDAGPRGIVTGQVLPAEGETQGGFAPSLMVDEVPAVYKGRVAKDVLQPASMALFRSVIDDIGGFDERLGAGSRFPSAEDNDFGFRVLEAGYRIVYHPEAVIYHRAWRSKRDYLPLRWRYGIGQGAYYAKYLSLHDRYMLRRMCRGVLRRFYLSACRMRRERHQAYGDALYALGILAGAAQWLLTQRRRP